MLLGMPFIEKHNLLHKLGLLRKPNKMILILKDSRSKDKVAKDNEHYESHRSLAVEIDNNLGPYSSVTSRRLRSIIRPTNDKGHIQDPSPTVGTKSNSHMGSAHVGTSSSSNENPATSTTATHQSRAMWYNPVVAPRFAESILTRTSTAESDRSWSSFGAQSSPSSATSYDTAGPTHGTTSKSASGYSEHSKIEGHEYGQR